MGKSFEKITDDMKSKLISLYNEGKMDTEIAKILNVTDGAIYYWRKKLKLKSKFTYSKVAKIDNSLFEELFYKGYTDKQIAEKLGMSENGVYSHRMRHKYFRRKYSENTSISLTEFQKQVLLGTLLGDSSLRRASEKSNVSISCAHGIKQKKYCEYKTDIFRTLKAVCKYHKRKSPDKRNGIFYEDYTMTTPANPELNIWYDSFYKEGKKVIPFNLFNYFTEVSLAFMFMDDGCKISKSFCIATNCFNKQELLLFKKFLYNKFDLETSIFKNNILYIRKISKEHFINLISPYICDSMKYKIVS